MFVPTLLPCLEKETQSAPPPVFDTLPLVADGVNENRNVVLNRFWFICQLEYDYLFLFLTNLDQIHPSHTFFFSFIKIFKNNLLCG